MQRELFEKTPVPQAYLKLALPVAAAMLLFRTPILRLWGPTTRPCRTRLPT